jgi:hypothetical protein
VNDVIVWLTFFGFLIAVFPVHIFNYIYLNTAERYASVNVTLYRYIKILNANTVKNSIDKMQINGKEKNFANATLSKNSLKIFNNLCFTKIIQLCDFGVSEGSNSYLVLTQHMLTESLYYFIKANGGRTKLRNYTVLNYTHDKVNYYLKVVGVINLITVGKIILMLITEKIINE